MPYGYHPMMMGYGWISQLIILGLFAFIVYWMIRNSGSRETALDILKKRYASGEISKKEFERLKSEVI